MVGNLAGFGLVRRQYANPPLIEAVCEFRFQSENPGDVSIPGLVYAELRNDFPRRLPNPSLGLRSIVTDPEGNQREVNQQLREPSLRFWRDDEAGAIIVGPNRLALSVYQPYPSWLTWQPIIKQAFGVYVEVANPTGIQRIGLRYINQIEHSSDEFEPDEFFNFYPFVGDSLPQDLLTFSMNVLIPFNEDRDRLRLQLNTGNRAINGRVPTILDLDYFLDKPGIIPIRDALDWLEDAHSHVEETFEGCLKDALREIFGQVEA